MSTSKRFNTSQLTFDAMLAALCAVLGYLAIDVGSLKITFESLPILIGALLFGPLGGFSIGGVGTLVYQLLRYGLSATTALWIAPYLLCGLLAGLYAQRQGFALTRSQTMAVVICNELLITLLNTGVIYLDSKIYGYYFPGIVTGALILRLVICVVKSAAFGMVLPDLLVSIKKAFHWRTA